MRYRDIEAGMTESSQAQSHEDNLTPEEQAYNAWKEKMKNTFAAQAAAADRGEGVDVTDMTTEEFMDFLDNVPIVSD